MEREVEVLEEQEGLGAAIRGVWDALTAPRVEIPSLGKKVRLIRKENPDAPLSSWIGARTSCSREGGRFTFTRRVFRIPATKIGEIK